MDDAIFLLRAGRNSSAYYLGGYAVELALKACIAKLFRSGVIPDKSFVNAIYVHKLDDLLGVAALRPNYQRHAAENPHFAVNWGIASQWTEQSRYEAWDAISAATLLNAIHDPNNGVFPWLRQHW